jgi:uncharacterized protein (DUF305 family)
MEQRNTPTSAPAQRATHNQADIDFATQMVLHHQQAVDMADLAASHGSTPRITDLAGRIKRAQEPEIQQMNGWLARWGATSASPSTGMDHGSGPGMMTDDEMRRLEQASGVEFDQMFLDMMIRHHQGAIEQATTELEQGASPEAKALAQRIIDTQRAEIAEMQELLGTV